MKTGHGRIHAVGGNISPARTPQIWCFNIIIIIIMNYARSVRLNCLDCPGKDLIFEWSWDWNTIPSRSWMVASWRIPGRLRRSIHNFVVQHRVAGIMRQCIKTIRVKFVNRPLNRTNKIRLKTSCSSIVNGCNYCFASTTWYCYCTCSSVYDQNFLGWYSRSALGLTIVNKHFEPCLLFRIRPTDRHQSSWLDSTFFTISSSWA